MFKVTSTPNAPAAIGPYSQALTVNGFLFASGQVPLMPGPFLRGCQGAAQEGPVRDRDHRRR